jgi:hypothetical protein
VSSRRSADDDADCSPAPDLGDLVDPLGVEVTLMSYVDDSRAFVMLDWPGGPVVIEAAERLPLIGRLELGSDGDWLPDDDDLDELLSWGDPEAVIVYHALTDAAWLQMAIPRNDPDEVRRCCDRLTGLGRSLRPRLAEDLCFSPPLDYRQRAEVGPGWPRDGE